MAKAPALPSGFEIPLEPRNLRSADFNFTIPEPTGVVGIVAPDEPAPDGLLPGRYP